MSEAFFTLVAHAGWVADIKGWRTMTVRYEMTRTRLHWRAGRRIGTITL